MRKFNDSGFFTVPVDNADVGIVWKNNYFGLQNSGSSDGMYNINNSNFEMLAGNSYRLEINYKSEFITGETTMPANFEDLEFSSSIYPVFNGDALNSPLVSSWRESNDLVYLVSITPPADATVEDQIVFSQLSSDEVLAIRENLDIPFEENGIDIHPAAFTYYGYNRIDIIAVDEEYQDFFNINENGTTFSNIKNGKGYFVGIAKRSTYILVQ